MKLVSQTPIVPGQVSTATVLGQDQNGTAEPVNLDLPPGKNATVPDNMATTDDLKEFISGTLGLGGQDLPATALHLRGDNGAVQLILGSAQSPVYKTMPTMDFLLDRLSSSGGAIKHGIAQNCTHGSSIQFPQAFADDDVSVIITVNDGGHARTATLLNPPNRNGFQLSLNYWNGSGMVNETLPSTIHYIAIGNVT